MTLMSVTNAGVVQAIAPVIGIERLTLHAHLAVDWPAFRDCRVSDRTVSTGGAIKEHGAPEQLASFFGMAKARANEYRDDAASHTIARHLGGKVIAGLRPTWFDDGDVYHFAKGDAE